MDFSKQVVVLSDAQSWENSPAAGVSRVKLEREGEESGHVTSIVRYDAGANFPENSHPNGEEIFVMEGTFSDEKKLWGRTTIYP